MTLFLNKTSILLINPPNNLGMGEGRFNLVIDIYQPLGLGYIAAVLEKAGYIVGIIDAKVEHLSEDEIIGRLLSFNPGIIGITATTPDFCSAVSLAKKIKSAGNYTILVGGAHVSALPEETMEETSFDYGVVGEGEQTIVELAEAIFKSEQSRIPQIKGIVFRDGSKIIRTSPREYIKGLDALPFPARHLFPPLEKYTYLYYKSLPLATIITSRGCPYQCTFCDRAVFGNQVRMRSIPNVLDEIEMLVKDYSIREVNIIDDLFTISHERVEEFCRGLLSRNLKISWSCMSRADRITPVTLRTMKQAGCWLICYGIESGNQKVLDMIKKNLTLHDIKRAVRWTHESGIQILGSFILGMPGEDEETLISTLRFAKNLPLDRVIFHILQPMPGSEIYKAALSIGALKKDVDYRYYHLYCFPEKLPFTSEGLTSQILRRYRRKAYRDFYLRPSYLFRQLVNRREMRQFFMRLRAFFNAIS